MKNDRHLFVIDLDGTALKNHYELHEGLIDSIQEIKSKGHKVCIVTGRPIKGCINFYNDLKLDTLIGTLNGNNIFDPKENKIINFCEFNSKSFIEFINIEKDWKHIIDFAYQKEGKIYSSHNAIELMTKWYHNRPWEQVRNLNDIPEKIECAFIMVDPKDSQLVETYFSNTNDIVMHKWEKLDKGMQVYELFNSSCTKGTTVEFLSKYYNIPLERTHVFGDGLNDLAMFKMKVNSYAVGNAHPGLKQHADVVLSKTNKENAVADAILQIIDNKPL